MDAENRKNLKELLKILQKANVKRFKCADFELEITEHIRPRRQSKADTKDPADFSLPQDDLLFWSSTQPGIN